MRERLLHHWLIAALVMAAALVGGAALAAPSASADVAQVTVVSPGGGSQTLALGALAGAEDVVARSYTLRSTTGESSQTVTGFSLTAILDAAGADPYGFSYLEVQRPAGGAVLLSRDQALDPGAFANGPPVVYAAATGTGFLRPNAGAEDFNANDSFEAPQGIAVVLRKGTQLEVKAKASATRVKVGQKVSFSAVVEGAGAGEQLSYSWYFDDGSSVEGDSPNHSFAKRGSYDVVVGVTTPGDDTGSSAVVTVQVGAPVVGGPDREGGGTNNATGAPDHGAADGPASGGAPSLGPGGSVGHAPPDTQPPAALSVRRGTTDRPSRDSKPPTPAEEQVEGELLSTSGVVLPEEEKQQAAARTGSLENGSGGGGLPTAALGLLTTLGLLGVGALIEARRLPGMGAFLSLSESKSPHGARR